MTLKFEILKRMKAVCTVKHNIIIDEYNQQLKELETKAAKGKKIGIDDYEDIF